MGIIIGSIITNIGLFGTIYTLYQLNELEHSFYFFSSSRKESLMIWLFLSMIVMFMGIITIILSVIRNRNKNRLDSIVNIERKDQYGNLIMKNTCPNCGLNLSDDCVNCPKCGTKLR